MNSYLHHFLFLRSYLNIKLGQLQRQLQKIFCQPIEPPQCRTERILFASSLDGTEGDIQV